MRRGIPLGMEMTLKNEVIGGMDCWMRNAGEVFGVAGGLGKTKDATVKWN